MRFQNLLADSHCLVKFDLSIMSKSNFQRYYTEIIQPNEHRIKSLSLPNIFMINHILTPICNALKLRRLETLNVASIFSEYLDELFQYLSTLPVLSELTISLIDYVKDKAKFYSQILKLSGLKYCKIQFEECYITKPLSITSNHSSSIEHLVIKDKFHINTLMVLLSYIPHLRHLSIDCLYRPDNEQIKSCSITFNQLTYIDLHMKNIVFDDFVSLIRILSPPLDTLRLSVHDDTTYLDGQKWQELILSEMPYLRIFDIDVSYFQSSTHFDVGRISKWESLFPAFQSSFYFDRRWFFASQYFGSFIFFYSTDPYRYCQLLSFSLIYICIYFDL
jgi:hypothetical protein